MVGADIFLDHGDGGVEAVGDRLDAAGQMLARGEHGDDVLVAVADIPDDVVGFQRDFHFLEREQDRLGVGFRALDVLAEDRGAEIFLKIEFFENVMAVALAQSVARQRHRDIVALQQFEDVINAGAGLDNLLDRFAAGLVDGAVDEELGRFARREVGDVEIVAAAREEFVEQLAQPERGIVHPFERMQEDRVDVPDAGAVHVEEHDCGLGQSHGAAL